MRRWQPASTGGLWLSRNRNFLTRRNARTYELDEGGAHSRSRVMDTENTSKSSSRRDFALTHGRGSNEFRRSALCGVLGWPTSSAPKRCLPLPCISAPLTNEGLLRGMICGCVSYTNSNKQRVHSVKRALHRSERLGRGYNVQVDRVCVRAAFFYYRTAGLLNNRTDRRIAIADTT